MRKIINPCSVKYGRVFCEITYKDGKLSIHGVIGPTPGGDARGGCGQINMSFAECYPDPTFNEGWDAETFQKFLGVWDKWRLNNMRTGCEHQRTRNTRNTQKKITLTWYTWGPTFHALRRAIENATATPEEYQEYQTVKARVYAVTIESNAPKYETSEIVELLTGGWVKAEKTEERSAESVSCLEHPEGLLCKPCSVCGYKYGSAWLREEVPVDVISFLESLPDSKITPPWI